MRSIAERTPQLEILHRRTFEPSPAISTESLPAFLAADADFRLVPDEQFERLTDDEVLLRAATAANGEKFLKLWRGDLSEHGNDHSVADLALVSILLYWTQGDQEQADRLFRQSNLVRPKWTDRVDYRRRTFEKAISS